ncbi:succinate--CoA ligase subunit alpha [Propylenella binzhouense]|nr:succinate--CoA ligase subunit alpha [Propylenella binzhouense]
MLRDVLGGRTPRVLVQGATGRAAQLHLRLMRRCGTEIVGGVSLTRKTPDVDGVPVFTGCAEAVLETRADTSVIMVPALSVLPAIAEAIDAGIRLVVSVTEGMPVQDAMRAWHIVRDAGADWIGPSTPGMAIPGRLKLGFLPDAALAPGPIGVMSKSGTLSYEVCRRLVRRGIGQSGWIGVGGDVVKGLRFADLVPTFHHHGGTRAVLVIGEIGGTEEEELAEALRIHRFDKPVFVVLAGSSAPEGVTMGHAGALIHGGRGTLASKQEALSAAGAKVFTRMEDAVEAIAEAIGGGGMASGQSSEETSRSVRPAGR